MSRSILPAALLVGLALSCLGGCGGSSAPRGIDSLPVDAEMHLSGLDGPVDVVTDSRGMPHIYATTEHDALMVQGYLMARDRLAQFEFYRRALQGTMAEIVSPVLAPGIVDQDAGARQLGFRRLARRIYDSLPADDPALQAIESFCAGVNLYIAEVRSGEANLPAGLGGILPPDKIADWSPVDTFTVARYMSYDLSRSAGDEIDLTSARLAVAEQFPADSPDPRLAARAGLLHDLWPLAPAEQAPSRDGFPNLDDDSGSRAFWQPLGPSGPAPHRRLPRAGTLRAAAEYFRWLNAHFLDYLGPGGGSNNWAVHGSHTAGGHPLLASDPHLSLSSPNFFWYVHLNTARAGGDLNASGLALFGTPGVLLGYNERIAWGLTVSNFDVDDVYLETIVPGSGGAPDQVVFRGQQVLIETITETIDIIGGDTRTVTIEMVPHHGPIIPGTHEPGGTEALSRRWVGYQVTNEVAALVGMLKAGSVEEVEQALDQFQVGSQNWMVVSADGDIYWTSQSLVPLRDPRALSYDPATGQGQAPCFVLPGDGDYEWSGEYLGDRYLPHDINPARGFLSTANQDQVGVTHDGNPFNDAYYLGWYFDLGHRNARISSRLAELVAAGGVTTDDLSQLQADDHSPLGERLAPALVQAVEHALAERDQAGTHPDLAGVVAELGARLERIAEMKDRLAAWTSYHTPAAVEGNPSGAEIADSVATTIFNATLTRLVHLAFDDEVARLGVQPGSQFIARALENAVSRPETMASYDAAAGDTVLWDDLDTDAVSESRDERMLRALDQALDFLEQRLGNDMDGWRWGKLHTVRLADITGLFGDSLSIPPEGDARYPDGYPRHGDNFNVDAANFGMWSTDDFSYRAGPQQRLVLEMTPDGPRAWNARAGGQSQDPDDPHFADDVEYWRRNQAPALYFTEAEVAAHAERRVRYLP